MKQRGAMSEINVTIWPALYGYTGWLWGTELGWPWTVTVLAVVAGYGVGMVMMSVNPFYTGPLAMLVALVAPWLVAAETYRWIALALCASGIVVGGAGLALGKRWV